MGGTNRSLDLFDVLENLAVLSQTEITTPLASVDDYIPVNEALALADSASVVNGAHVATYNYDAATSLWGLGQYL